jgi:hypothetical protein
MCHKLSPMVVPVLVDRVIRNFFHELHIQFSQRTDPIKFIITLVKWYIIIVLIVEFELISMSLRWFGECINARSMGEERCF